MTPLGTRVGRRDGVPKMYWPSPAATLPHPRLREDRTPNSREPVVAGVGVADDQAVQRLAEPLRVLDDLTRVRQPELRVHRDHARRCLDERGGDVDSVLGRHVAVHAHGALSQLQHRFDTNIINFMDLVEASKHYSCVKRSLRFAKDREGTARDEWRGARYGSAGVQSRRHPSQSIVGDQLSSGERPPRLRNVDRLHADQDLD